MLYEDPFERAGLEARERGVCPVTLLDDLCTEHWAFDELCLGFDCETCVAADEDMGLNGEPECVVEPEGGWEIPF